MNNEGDNGGNNEAHDGSNNSGINGGKISSNSTDGDNNGGINVCDDCGKYESNDDSKYGGNNY